MSTTSKKTVTRKKTTTRSSKAVRKTTKIKGLPIEKLYKAVERLIEKKVDLTLAE